MAAITRLSLVLAALLNAAPAAAAEPVTIEKLLTDPQSYHLKMVALQGIAHQIQILTSPPPALPQLDTRCLMVHPPYTFVLSDETGFLQITVRARPPCVSKHSPAEPPDVADGDTVSVEAQITVAQGSGPGASGATLDVLAVNIQRANQP
ncbi:MAG TPA: hypothetical protein VES96_01055 [Nitrospiraceae bacterium]|nr:hypothetical protein [Nitrospiraceae bacterium]